MQTRFPDSFLRRPKELCLLLSRIRDTIQRGRHPFTRHTHEFELPVFPSHAQKYFDKAEQRRVIMQLRTQGWSYREIGREVGLHWTRVGQIVKDIEKKHSSGKQD